MSRILNVHIGQIKAGGEGDVLKALLGSCVGIALLWKRKRRFALAHCLLPEAPPGSPDRKGRFVNQAVPNLLKALDAAPEDRRELVAVIAGGGKMVETESKEEIFNVGSANLHAARKSLTEHRIFVEREEPGGDQGTQIIVDGTTGECDVRKIAKME